MTDLLPIDPEYVAFDVTYRCNADCYFCFLKNRPSLSKRQKEISLKGIKKIIDSFGDTRRKFYITGGEPLLRKDLPGIIKYLKKRGHKCTLTTNGISLNERNIASLLKCGIDEIVFSLHGGKDAHEKALGINGVFEKILNNFSAAVSSKHKRGSRIIIWCTVNKYNFQSLYDTCHLFLSLNPDGIAFNHLEFIDAESFRASSKIIGKYFRHHLEISPSDGLGKSINARVLGNEVRKIKNLGRDNINFYPDLSYSEIAKWYKPGIALKRGGICYGQWKSLWISPSGDVLSCQPLAEKFGNIKGGAYLRVYNSKKYNIFRDLLKKAGGLFPLCSRCGRVPYQTYRRPL